MSLIGKMYVIDQNINKIVQSTAAKQNRYCFICTYLHVLIISYLLHFQELGAWKTRRRKQSEDAFQRVAEVKALEDDGTGEPRKL